MKLARPIKNKTPTVSGKFTTSHKAYDYAEGDGTPVYASEAGKVTYAKGSETRQWLANTNSDPFRPQSGTRKLNNEDYGNRIQIDHGSGFSTLYAHLKYESLYVKAGDQVKKGQIIGRVGSTGNSTGNHLHHEVYLNGVLVDLNNYIDRDFDGYLETESTPSDPLQACLKAHREAVDAANQKDQMIKNLQGELASCNSLRNQGASALEHAEKENKILSLEKEDLEKKVRILNEDNLELSKLKHTKDDKISSLEEQLLKLQKELAKGAESTKPIPYKRLYEDAVSELEHYKILIDQEFVRRGRTRVVQIVQRVILDIENYLLRR